MRMSRIVFSFAALFLAAAVLAMAQSATAPKSNLKPKIEQQIQRPVLLINIKGAIGVGTHYHILRGLEAAKARNAGLVILRIDAPGGLVSATREIISAILASPIPVAVYVAPSGARAASAGTYIAYAAHVAAMAPGTHLGAATPVQMGAPSLPTAPKSPTGDKKDKPPQSAMQKKVLNDAVAYIRTLAELRGRNADWAEKAVREGATLTAIVAEKNKVVDFLANGMNELLQKAHGREVKVAGGTRIINAAGAEVTAYEPGWKAKFITAVTNPNVAFILMLIGVYGIIFEFWNPGLTGSGIVGAVCLLVGFAALSVLPLNYAGLGLLVLGMALMAVEAFAPGFGILGIGGIAAFLIGSIFLFDPAGADFDLRLSWPVIVSATLTSALMLVLVLGMAVRASRRAVVTGAEEVAGSFGRVIDWEQDAGRVRYHGEIWSAKSVFPLKQGDPVRIVTRDGLTLQVERQGKQES